MVTLKQQTIAIILFMNKDIYIYCTAIYGDWYTLAVVGCYIWYSEKAQPAQTSSLYQIMERPTH